MKISLLITIVGIFKFISRENFVLSRFRHGKSFIYLGPGLNKTYIWANAQFSQGMSGSLPFIYNVILMNCTCSDQIAHSCIIVWTCTVCIWLNTEFFMTWFTCIFSLLRAYHKHSNPCLCLNQWCILSLVSQLSFLQRDRNGDMAPDKELFFNSKSGDVFSYFSMKTYVVGTQ